MPDLVTTTQDPATTGVARAEAAPRATDRIPREVAVGLGVAWFVCYTIASALEPRTSHPMPVIGVVLGAALLVGILVTVAGLVARRRWGVTASLGTSVLLVASSVACPTTGHHGFGLWWFGQMAVSTALVVASVVALRRS